ncbi:acyl carrier protein [Streptomyces sannanensis]|uniref:Acyl carrier protein n=1 Tax=Streptomyces sannanensis TaxID=285536 RepID=A0ABP6SF60_9ACTN
MTETAQTPAIDRARVAAAVTEALGDVLERDLSGLSPDTELFGELGLDSTGVLDLLLRLEDLTGCEFDTDELEMSHFATVASLTDFVLAETGS